MCLITKKPIKIATKDIVVYKILIEDMMSPHYCFTYKLGKKYSAKIQEGTRRWLSTDSFATDCIVNLYNKDKKSEKKYLV